MIPAIVGSLVPALFDLVDDLFTSDEERAEAKRKLYELEQQGRLAQIAVNMQEAQSESVFVSGWRPAVGWICGFAFFYAFILQPFMTFIAVISEVPKEVLETLPDLDLGTMMPVLLGMLGLAGARTFEKKHGANKKR